MEKSLHMSEDRINKIKKELLGIKTKLWYSKRFFKNFISNKNEKEQIFINKTIYLALSILEISKIVMYEFWYDYLKPKYGEKAKLCYMDTDRFIACTKTRYLCRHCKKM